GGEGREGRGREWHWLRSRRAGERPTPAAPPKVSVVGAERIAAWIALREQGRDQARAGKWKEAVDSFSRALELVPDDAACWNYRGFAHSWLGQWDKTLADCSRAAELQPTEPSYHRNRGEVLARLGQWEKAAAALGQVPGSQADSLQVRYWLALLVLQCGDRAGYRKACVGMLER